jgi:hypothetical protein
VKKKIRPYLHLRGEFLLQEQQGLLEISLAVSNRAKSENPWGKTWETWDKSGENMQKMVGDDRI